MKFSDNLAKNKIINNPDEVIAFLKANQKGGNKLPKEKVRKLGNERFEKYFEEFVRSLIEKNAKKEKATNIP